MDKQVCHEVREYDFAVALSEMQNLPLQQALYICQYLRNFFREKILEGKSVYVFGIGRFQVKKKKFSHCRNFQSGKDIGEKEVSILHFTNARSLRVQLNQKDTEKCEITEVKKRKTY
jgi:bacterial DNA-binding protein